MRAILDNLDFAGNPPLSAALICMAVIVFAAVYGALGKMPGFKGPAQLPVALAVTALGFIGLNEEMVRLVINHYGQTIVVILITVALAIRTIVRRRGM